jgi:hypothetical protein
MKEIKMINEDHPYAVGLTADERYAINELHRVRQALLTLAYSSEEIAKKVFAVWEANEYALQELWGFERNAVYHRSYNYPFCICPKMDNDDCYPHHMIITTSCPIHNFVD